MIRSTPRYVVASVQDGRWTIDVGRIHGIPTPTPDDATDLALFDFGATDEDLTAVEQDRESKGDPGRGGDGPGRDSRGSPTRPGPLKAVISISRRPGSEVALEGDAGGIEPARRGRWQLEVRPEPTGGEAADFRVIAQRKQYLIAKPDDDRPLVGQIDGYADASARQAVERLEHIERWKTTVELDNPATTIGTDELQVEILQNGRAAHGVGDPAGVHPGTGTSG